MPVISKNIDYSKSTINELYNLVKSALIEEQLGIHDNSNKLKFLYEELLNRNRPDVYDEAVDSAIAKANTIEEIMSGSQVVNIRELSPGSRFELTEMLRATFKTVTNRDKLSATVQFLDILNTLGMDEDSFFCEVGGESMIEANIFEGDTLIVGKNKQANSGDLVVVKIADKIFVKRFVSSNGSKFFASENPDFKPFEISRRIKYEILGIVKTVIHKVRNYSVYKE